MKAHATVTVCHTRTQQLERHTRRADVLIVAAGKPGLIGAEHVRPGAIVIDARGKVLMPGLIDAHWHSMLNFWPVSKVLSSDFGYLSIAAVKPANEVLLRAFTTVRDPAGNCMPVKKAIDAGLVDGPRIYPSLGAISQTAGHFDFRGSAILWTRPILHSPLR